MEIYEPSEPWKKGDMVDYHGRDATGSGDRRFRLTPAGPNYIEERDIRDVETLNPHRCPVCMGAGVIWREDTR